MISFATNISLSWCFVTLWVSMSTGVTHQMAICRTSRMRHRLNMAGAQHKSLPITRALTSQRQHTLWRSRCFAHSTRARFIMAQLIYDRRGIPRSYPFLRRVLASEVSSHWCALVFFVAMFYHATIWILSGKNVRQQLGACWKKILRDGWWLKHRLDAFNGYQLWIVIGSRVISWLGKKGWLQKIGLPKTSQNCTPAWLSTCSCSILLLLVCNLQHTDSSGEKTHTPTDITDIIQLVVQLAFVLFLLVTLQIQLTSLWKSQVIDDLSMKSWFSIAMLIYQGVHCCIYTPMFLACFFTLMHHIPISSSTDDVSWYGSFWLDAEFKSGFCRWCFHKEVPPYLATLVYN